MEFTNEIFFNKNLVAEESVIITYCGKLYREHSEDIYIVYGYGNNWEYTEETQMKETENGFEVTINLRNYDKFNFCFKNNFNIWDNNSDCNYIATISPKITSDSETTNEDLNTQEQTNDNDDNNNTPLIDGNNSEISEGYSAESAVSEDDSVEETEEEASTQEQEENSSAENFENQSQDDIDVIFSNLLNTLLENVQTTNETINLDNGYGLQSVDEIKEENFEEKSDELLKEFYEELETVPTPTTNTDLDELFSKAFKELEDDTKYQQASNSNSQELDNLMNDIVNSITNDSSLNTAVSPVSEIETTSDTQNVKDIVSGLPAVQSGSWFDKFVNTSKDFFKSAGKALKKFGTLVKLKAQEYGIINEKE